MVKKAGAAAQFTTADYVQRAMMTVPDDFHIDTSVVRAGAIFMGLVKAARAANNLDAVKKGFVYKRPVPADHPLSHATDVDPPKGDVPEGVIHGLVGLINEGGELAEILLTSWFGRDDLDKINLREELGGMFWYLARTCSAMQAAFPDEDWSFDTIMKANIAQLELRHGVKDGQKSFNPNAYDKAQRDLEGERAAIENASGGAQTASGQGAGDDLDFD